MANSSGMKLIGDKELERTFKQLGDRVQRRVTRGAVNAATTPIVKAAKQKASASKESGLLKKSLGKKVRTYVEKKTVVGIVGPRKDIVGEYKGKKRWPAKYGHLVERGHIAADGSHVPPRPFLRPAYDETQGEAVAVMSDKMAAGVIKEASRGNK